MEQWLETRHTRTRSTRIFFVDPIYYMISVPRSPFRKLSKDNYANPFSEFRYLAITLNEDSTSTFLGLPVEIRREILTYLLMVQCAPCREFVRGQAHFSTCKDCRPLAGKRDELRGYSGLQAEILLVCRQLHTEGLDIISDNQFVTVRRPQGLGDSLLSQLRLGHWKVASGVMPELQPIIMFSIDKGDWTQSDPPKDLLLFDLRDLSLVVRYLLHGCRAYASGRVVDVCINKLHVP